MRNFDMKSLVLGIGIGMVLTSILGLVYTSGYMYGTDNKSLVNKAAGSTNNSTLENHESPSQNTLEQNNTGAEGNNATPGANIVHNNEPSGQWNPPEQAGAQVQGIIYQDAVAAPGNIDNLHENGVTGSVNTNGNINQVMTGGGNTIQPVVPDNREVQFGADG